MVKRVSSPRKKYLIASKKFKNKPNLTRQELDELLILIAKSLGYLKDDV